MFAMYIGGARDYVLILTGDTSYVSTQFGPGGVSYFAEYPLGYRILWTVNVLGGLLAPVLLIVRRGSAFPVAATSLACQVVLLALTLAFRDRWNALGPMIGLFDIIITLVTAAFAYYCWRMRPNLPLSTQPL